MAKKKSKKSTKTAAKHDKPRGRPLIEVLNRFLDSTPFTLAPASRVPTLEECEKVCGPARCWKGRCHEISVWINTALALGWFERYGVYSGEVKKGYYTPGRIGYQHGWLELPDGRVFDPTRWVFEAVKPYLYVSEQKCKCDVFDPDSGTDGMTCVICGHTVEEHAADFMQPCLVGSTDEYDIGAERMLEEFRRDRAPPLDDGKPPRFDFTLDSDGVEVDFVKGLFPGYPDLGFAQLFYLGNLGPLALGELARPIYEKLVAVGHAELIPYDFRVMVLKGGRY